MKTKFFLIFEIIIMIVVFVFLKDWYQDRNEIYSVEGKLISYVIDSSSYNNYTYDELKFVDPEMDAREFLYMDKFYKLCNNEAVDDFIQDRQYLNYMQVVEGYNIVKTEIEEIKIINDRSGKEINEDVPENVNIRTYSARYKYIDNNGKEYELVDMFLIYADGNKITYVLNKYTQRGVQKMLIDLIY